MPSPRDIFSELPINPSSPIRKLWPHQEEVLDRYAKDLKDETRLAFELPTGSGKTLIALLILEWWRRQGKRVAILSSSKALAEDIQSKAQDVGIPTVVVTGTRGLSEDELKARSRELRQYKRCQSVAVMNYWAYLYGDFVTPDILVVDDAHSFENAAQNIFTVEIARDDHSALYAQIATTLKKDHPIYQKLESIERYLTPAGTDEPIYLPHLNAVVKDIHAYFLDRKSKGEKDWEAQRNLNRLHTYLMFVARDGITLAPAIPPMELEEKFRTVGRIIYMSATLGGFEVLHKSVGSHLPIRVLADRDLKSQVGTMGKRLVFPVGIDVGSGFIDERVLEAIATILKRFGKAIVFATSKDQRDEIGKYLVSMGLHAFHYNFESDAENFTSQPSGALVTAGRYVGLDMPSRVCQVGIVVRIPFAVDPLDAFAQNHLHAMEFTYQKVAHRLVQAFGRCNRSLEDRAIYFVLDGRLEAEIDGEERLLPYFPRELLAQTELGYDLSNRSLTKAIEVGEAFLKGELAEYETELDSILKSLPSLPHGGSDAPPVILSEVKAWSELVQRLSYFDAGQIFAHCAEVYGKTAPTDEDSAARAAWFWYWSAMCDFLQYKYQKGGNTAKESCVTKLERAISLGPSSWFKNIRTLLNELRDEALDKAVLGESAVWAFREKLFRTWEEFRFRNTAKGGKKTPSKALDAIADAFLCGNHDQVVDAAEQLFLLMGFEVQNTSKKVGEDDLHLFANDTSSKFMVLVEVKSKEQGKVLSKSDIDQTKGNVDRYRTKYSAIGMHVFPIAITNKEGIDSLATQNSVDACRVFDSEALVYLVRLYQRFMEGAWQLGADTASRISYLERVPSQDSLRALFAPSANPKVALDELGKFQPVT